MRIGVLCRVALITLVSALEPGLAQSGGDRGNDVAPESEFDRAEVTLDGEVLFRVRGISAYPAARRAEAISERIRAFADTGTPARELKVIEVGNTARIAAGSSIICAFSDADATAEGAPRELLAQLAIERIAAAVRAYRIARSPGVLTRGATYAAAATAVFVLALFLLMRVFRRVGIAADRLGRAHIEKAQYQALRIVEAERLAASTRSILRFLRTVALFFVCLAYLDVVLALFPWTRPASHRVFQLVLDPLQGMALGFIDFLPRLAFLVVLVMVVIYLLRLQRTVLNALKNRTITISDFDPDWADPAYRILRLITVAFALVVAYPYLPGSGSEAFKGISIFIGLMFSLASSSALANSIAGYALIFRRTYKVGDRVQIGEMIGSVRKIGAQVTHVHSIKNEELIIPNSAVIASHVVNHSTLAKARGLILHTNVGIGYETPWRQVEAMLRLAASRTTRLKTDPPPFVLQRALADFAVTYELNVYCDEPHEQEELYTELHRNILDVFNEYGVQIMTPAYMADPAEPKIVPKNKFFETPAEPVAAVSEMRKRDTR